MRERYREEDLQRLRGFRPIDDTFMRCLFQDDLPLAQLVLRIITGKEDLVLTRAETQKDLKRLLGARSLCLDVHGVDSEQREYDIEVQRADNGARPERARYHSAAMDIEALNAGQAFEELPETYTIFITENDFFGMGTGVYPIERMNLVTDAPFNDRAHILYVNGRYKGDDPLGRLMHDFMCSDPDDMHYDLLAERSRYYKEDPKGVSDMCKAMDDLRNEALERGRIEGRLDCLIESVRSLKTRLGFTDQQIREALNISNDDWERIAVRV
ncbi:MAG: PD-(D/E)XK nuclease family transposase [Clostridia bacterium]|nr:PD-(D/E)XK nuclease family transposase [Clostridia bacterium]